MKIGIYTLPLNYNYGGLLQAYALQAVLERMGHEVVVIDRPYIKKVNIFNHPRELLRRLKTKYICNKNIRIFNESYEYKVYPAIEVNTRKFINQYIHHITIDNPNLLSKNNFDAIVVGSDQIWRAGILGNSKNRYNSFLEFAKDWDCKRIAYAPSFGVDTWEYSDDETKVCQRLIKSFDAISVREQSGIKLCKEHLYVDAKRVLDPTLLLTKEDYIKLFHQFTFSNQRQEKLMAYILDESDWKMRIVNTCATQLNIKAFKVNSKADDIWAPIEERIQPPVEDWIRGFRDSDYIVTDSFHACVFSIIFGKPFLVIGNKNRGMTRFISLLEIFGLEDRLVDSDFNGKLPQSSIEDAQLKLKILSQESIAWLKDAIEN